MRKNLIIRKVSARPLKFHKVISGDLIASPPSYTTGPDLNNFEEKLMYLNESWR